MWTAASGEIPEERNIFMFNNSFSTKTSLKDVLNAAEVSR